MIKLKTSTAIAALALLPFNHAFAASCCGGGSSNSIVLPKFNDAMFDVNQNIETYEGRWLGDSRYQEYSSDTDLTQYRTNMALAKRLSDNWQGNIFVPLVHNETHYSDVDSESGGLGDTTISLWYEAFENVTCVYAINGWQSLKPSIYFGSSLTIPTGKSRYSDDVDIIYDTTGLGFYRLDAQVMLEKTVYPWSTTVNWVYGEHLERSVNQDYDTDVEPYNITLGPRHSLAGSLGYTWFWKDMAMVTFTGTYTDLTQGRTTIDNEKDPSTGLRKISHAFSLSYSTPRRDWIFKIGYSESLRGRNNPKTNTFNGGLSYVY